MTLRINENSSDQKIIDIARLQFELHEGFTKPVRDRLASIIWTTRTNPLHDLGFDTEVFGLGGYNYLDLSAISSRGEATDVKDFDAPVCIDYHMEFSGK